jgi:hypothetical protein
MRPRKDMTSPSCLPCRTLWHAFPSTLSKFLLHVHWLIYTYYYG